MGESDPAAKRKRSLTVHALLHFAAPTPTLDDDELELALVVAKQPHRVPAQCLAVLVQVYAESSFDEVKE